MWLTSLPTPKKNSAHILFTGKTWGFILPWPEASWPVVWYVHMPWKWQASTAKILTWFHQEIWSCLHCHLREGATPRWQVDGLGECWQPQETEGLEDSPEVRWCQFCFFVLHSGKLTWQWKVDPFGRCFPYWTSGNSIVILVYWRANDSNHQFCGFHTFQEVVNPDTWVQNFWTKVIGLVHFLTAIFLRLPLAVRLEVVPSMASSPRSCSKLAMILRLTARCTRQSDRMWS